MPSRLYRSMTVDAASGVALWRQVADGSSAHRRRPLGRGRAAAGGDEIAETYRVNRHTVRRALAALAERGRSAPSAAAAPT
jgi:GntR family phosphonate transport system transcriptional regulator